MAAGENRVLQNVPRSHATLAELGVMRPRADECSN